jgi:hypothetical protein
LSERKAHFWALGLMLAVASLAESATYRRMSLDSLIRSSDLVIYGCVAQNRSLRDAATGLIWTQTDIRVCDALKGRPGASITVTEPGGVREGIGEFYPGVPRFRPDEELVLFLYRTPQNRLRVTGAAQGIYAVRSNPQTGEKWVQPGENRAEIAYEEGSASGRRVGAQPGGKDRLSRFLYDIRQKVATR